MSHPSLASPSDEIRVAISGRTWDHNVGGNTTYVRKVYEHLRPLQVVPEIMRPPGGARPGRRAVRYGLFEAAAMQRRAERAGLPIVHYPADTGPVRRSRGCKTLVTLHGAASLYEPSIRSGRAANLWLARAKRAAQVADLIITVSESSKRSVLDLVGDSADPWIEVIPHGFDRDRFRPAEEDEVARARTRHELRRPFVFYIGNLEPRKNLVELVGAVDALNAAGHDLELVIAGKPAWDAAKTVAAIEASRNARRLGWVEDDEIRALMTACELFAFPSLYEGFGLPVLEAMACGAPVMCSRRGSLPEVGGDAATYTDDIGSDAIADAIVRCLSGDRTAQREAGLAQAARFSWDESARRHRALYESLLTR